MKTWEQSHFCLSMWLFFFFSEGNVRKQETLAGPVTQVKNDSFGTWAEWRSCAPCIQASVPLPNTENQSVFTFTIAKEKPFSFKDICTAFWMFGHVSYLHNFTKIESFTWRKSKFFFLKIKTWRNNILISQFDLFYI